MIVKDISEDINSLLVVSFVAFCMQESKADVHTGNNGLVELQ